MSTSSPTARRRATVRLDIDAGLHPELPADVVFPLTAAALTWWRCGAGHRWRERGKTLPRRCPACSIPSPVAVAAALPTDGALLRHLVEQDLLPQFVGPAAAQLHHQVTWLCRHGHTWRQRAGARHAGDAGCPRCEGTQAAAPGLRTSRPERLMSALVELMLGERSVPELARHARFSADAYFPGHDLVLQYDGAYWHTGIADRDRRRDAVFSAAHRHYLVLREHQLGRTSRRCHLRLPSGAVDVATMAGLLHDALRERGLPAVLPSSQQLRDLDRRINRDR